MRSTAAVLAVALFAASCTQGETTPSVNSDLAEAAYDLCPILWQWQLEVGEIMNEMSREAFDEQSPSGRLDIYLNAMDNARSSLDRLRDRLAGLPPDRFQQFFRAEVETGLEQADAAIDLAEADVKDRYTTVAQPTYQEIVPSLFLSFEKVIDLAKPELASYGDPELIPAFQTVAQCQHGVKDADDGVPRYVPLFPEPTG